MTVCWPVEEVSMNSDVKLLTEARLKAALNEALASLGVVAAANQNNPNRWSPFDLATDLAELLANHFRQTTRRRRKRPRRS
jgi:hypothetical protein